jgi:hypothetical protein
MSTNGRPNLAFEGPRSSTKRHKAFTHDPLKEIRGEMPSNRRIEGQMKNPRKGSENHRKRETGGETRTLEESRQTFYTHHERFIQGRACLLNIHPLSRSHHEALKLVLEN